MLWRAMETERVVKGLIVLQRVEQVHLAAYRLGRVHHTTAPDAEVLRGLRVNLG